MAIASSKGNQSIMDLRSIRVLVLGVFSIFVISSLALYVTLEVSLDPERTGSLFGSNTDGGGIRGPNLSGKIKTAVDKYITHRDPTVSISQQAPAATANKPISKLRSKGEGSSKLTRRQIFEETYPPDDLSRVRKVLHALAKPHPTTQPNMTYDIHNCPADPPSDNYPMEWNLVQMLKGWNPDSTDIPKSIYQGLCIFDWEEDKEPAERYRKAEVPFIVKHHPDVMRTAERWNHPSYLHNLVGSTPQRNEYSKTNHFMFWRTARQAEPPKGWKAPTDNVELPFDVWHKRAQQLEASLSHDEVNRERWYFRLNGAVDKINTYLYDELPFFQTDTPSFFMVDPTEERGINCRFGMRGIIAESHFDPTRNWIIVLGGQRRYILSHPKQCQNLELYPVGHPSARHSRVNWSDPPNAGPFAQATASEVLLQPGDALYLPTSWFHFIVSLNINYQCNARSGSTAENNHYFDECGYPLGKNGWGEGNKGKQ